MNSAMTICKKELKTYFNSPIAYVVLAVFLVITGWFFASSLFLAKQASMRHVIEAVIPLVLFFFVPAITMRLVAEEKRAGTLELLMTMPVETWQIVIGKFLASLALLFCAFVLTLPYIVTIVALGKPDIGAIIAGYVGLLLLGSAYLSVGIFASSITHNQIIAFIASFVILLVFFMFNQVTALFSGQVASAMQFFSTDFHFQNIARGVLDSRDVIFLLSFSALFLFLSNLSLKSIK